ncbi:glycyl tRNA-synthetase [Tupanvirus deep ocean]|uniref:Glycyl tRNA-synthetase n=2 Tax=Tupanvirus TaxID=2094720 RepID=A0AC62AA71_9VIRU|nr:glycyl tRNA-synthetase [Tupanvirus deep ocean]QKU34609.1 glycyl tRNA-synthetase [Tupanvirus deep ocean]
MLKTFLQENQFIIPSYQHYGGFTGFQDYGVLGFQLKNKIINLWRSCMLDSNIYEVEIPSIMSHSILKASGHVDRFTDYVVHDSNGLCYRADHLAKKWFNEHNMPDMANQVDSWNQDTLELNINNYQMLDCQVKVTKKNLMIEVPSNTLVLGADTDFLRPELAQGIFVNFKVYQSYFQHEDAGFKPFGIAQVGKSYRKEISPQPFTRMREFTQAEIEYFFDPENKSHNNFKKYEDVVIPLLTDNMQENGIDVAINTTIKNAIEQNLISHQLMAYFLGKIYTFAKKLGLKDNKIRFRQHQKNEMAHYANQCWDLECLVNGSWLECVGCADRGCYDLTAHSKINSKQPLSAKRKLAEPIVTTNILIKPNISKMPNIYGKFFNSIKTYFAQIDQDTAKEVAGYISKGGDFMVKIEDCDYMFHDSMFTVSESKVNITHQTFVPHVLEPSFGIDRLFYAVLEQNIWQREIDERRLVLSLTNDLVLYDVAVFPLHKKEEMCKLADEIKNRLVEAGYKCYTDDSGTAIGKKYVRCDEIGVKYAVTVDPGTLKNGIVTIRNRDTMNQITVHYNDLTSELKKLN